MTCSGAGALGSIPEPDATLGCTVIPSPHAERRPLLLLSLRELEGGAVRQFDSFRRRRGQKPSSTIFPRALPLSTRAWARRRLLALI